MDRNRAVKGTLAIAVVFCALFAIWLSLGGFREDSTEPFPARTNGQTMQPTTVPTAAPTPSTSGTSAEPGSTGEASADPVSGLPWVALTALPPEVAVTLDEIEAGPPYPYDRDGVTFENREGLLPAADNGYYEEFTVTTPGSGDRGARRVIWGLEDEFYYTDDHYASFVRIRP